MPEIKTRSRSEEAENSTVSLPQKQLIKKQAKTKTIKLLDKAAIASERMRTAFVRTKDKVENLSADKSDSPTEYAEDRIQNGTECVCEDVRHAASVVSRRAVRHGKELYKKKREAGKAEQAAYPHEPDISGSKPRLPTRSYESKSIKTVQRTEKTIKQRHRTEKATIKTAENVKKSASKTVKTAETTSHATIKTAEASAKAAQKTVQVSAGAAQRTQQAAKVASDTVKTTAKATASAVKGLIAALKALIASISAGGVVALVLVIVLIIIGSMAMVLGHDDNDNETLPVSAEVQAYEPIIRFYARKHGIGDYVLLVEAVMMQESGGRGTDPLQCSESGYNTRYPHAPGSITDPEYSIDVGIQTLASCLQSAGCDGPTDMEHIKLALQGYNYGSGYITWALSKYGEYSKTNAIEFSLMMAERMGWSGYGDMDYVSHVLRYYPIGQLFYDPDNSTLIVEVAASQIGNVGGEPYWSWYGYSGRVEWCACFVSWCANQCGYIDAGIIPQYAGCGEGINWFKARGQWADGRIEPTPGMIIFFDWDNKGESGPQDGIADHTAIVEKVENGFVYTIEGNSGDRCIECRYYIGHYEIYGYGIPDYG